MDPFPHRYTVVADAHATANSVTLRSGDLDVLESAPPVEFDGRDDVWSPEHLIVASVADCYAITFQGIARRSRLPWVSLTCEVEGTLDRVDGVTRFTRFVIRPQLRLVDDTHQELARRILRRAEETCLITRSLNAVIELELWIESPDLVPA